MTTPKPTTETDWEVVIHDEGEGEGRGVRRLAVPGGWIYQVSMNNLSVADDDGWATRQHGWSPPVYVPDPEAARRRIEAELRAEEAAQR